MTRVPLPAHRRGRVVPPAVLAAVILAAGILYTWKIGAPGSASRPAPATATASVADATDAPLDGGDAIEPAQRNALGALLLAREDFASDFRFLLAASLRDRCAPTHAHELARMAIAAGVPVLADAKAALTEHPELRHPAYALVSRLAATAPCGTIVHVAVGGFAIDLDLERYAAMFPDSYFTPDLDAPPSDIAGRDLRERAADPCTPVVYAALPLNTERTWQCTGLRATLRRRLRGTCTDALREGSPVDARMSARLVASIRDELQQLPSICR